MNAKHYLTSDQLKPRHRSASEWYPLLSDHIWNDDEDIISSLFTFSRDLSPQVLRMNRDVDRGRVTAGDRCSRLFAPPLLNHHAAIHFVRLHASSCLHAGVCSPFRSSLDDEWLPLQGGLHTHAHTDTHMHTQAHTRTTTYTLANRACRQKTDTHTHTHDKHLSALTQDTHTNAKGFLMISDRIKRVGSKY